MNAVKKLEALKQSLCEKKRLLISFSGGVDSSLLAALAKDALGEGALAVILASETMPESEVASAQALASNMGLACRTVRFSILECREFAANPANRCYICKRMSALQLKGIAAEVGIECIADGINLSDYQDWRPGIAASDEDGIWHPFVQARLAKEDIRLLAKTLNLPVWNKPASACLASRIPYGEAITADQLKMIGEAEEALRKLGFVQMRVRCHGRLARVELSDPEISRAVQIRQKIVNKLRAAGFDYVALDLQGYRSGSMNEVLIRSKVNQ